MDHPSLSWPRSIITPAICPCSLRIHFCSSVICFALGRLVSQNSVCKSHLPSAFWLFWGGEVLCGDWEQRKVAFVLLLLAAFLPERRLSDCQRCFSSHLTLFKDIFLCYNFRLVFSTEKSSVVYFLVLLNVIYPLFLACLNIFSSSVFLVVKHDMTWCHFFSRFKLTEFFW